MPDNTELDILHHVERLTKDINDRMAGRSKSAFRRYPITFALLVLFGVVAGSEGSKGVLEEAGLIAHPWYLLIGGLILLIITGTVYHKLDK